MSFVQQFVLYHKKNIGLNWPIMVWTDQSWSELTMIGLNWPWLVWTDHDWSEVTMNGLNWPWMVWTDHDWSELTMIGLNWPWLVWTDHDWSELTMIGLNWPWLVWTDLILVFLVSEDLTRSVCLCSSVWKGWPLPIFLISVLALQLLWVVLVWDLQLEVILLCRDTGRVGFKVFCCGWSEMLEQIAGWTQRFVGWSRDFRETLENTLVQSWFFWLGTHFWVCITFCRVRYNVRLIIIIIIKTHLFKISSTVWGFVI